MTRAGTAYIDVDADLGAFKKDLDKQVKSQADKTEKHFGGAFKRIGQAGKVAALALGGGLLAAGGFAFKAVGAASDLGEQMSKNVTVFGDSSRATASFAKNAAKNFGLSETAALTATGTFGNLFRALDIGTSQSAAMSQSVVALGADLASFNNADQTEVLDALKAGLLGEAEPLRKFGVSLSAARIEAEALSMGIAKAPVDLLKLKTAQLGVEKAMVKAAEATKKYGKGSLEARTAQAGVAKAQDAVTKAMAGTKVELTAAQKAQAAYSVIMKDTKIAQGDFERTSGGLANQTRILKAQFDNVVANLGKKLIPVATRLAKFFNDKLIPAVSTLGTFVKEKVVPAFLAFGKFIADNIGVIIAIAAPIMAIAVALGVMTAATWLQVTAVAAWNAVLAVNPLVLIAIALSVVIAVLVIAYKKFDWFHKFVDKVWQGIQVGWDALMAGFKWAWDNVGAPLFRVMSTVFSYWWTNVVQPVFVGIATAAVSAWAWAKAAWDNVGAPTFKIIKDELANLAVIFDTVKSAATEAWKVIGDQVAYIYETVLRPIFSAVKEGMDAAGGLLGLAKSLPGPAGDLARAGSMGADIAGGKASGGPVSRGKRYLVGERGPEIFMPSVSGTIIPNHALAAAGSKNITINNFHPASTDVVLAAARRQERLYG